MVDEETTKREGAALEGTVRGPRGEPVEGARVWITDAPVGLPEIAAVTNADGRFRFALPVAGEYTLVTEAESRTPASARATVTVPPSADGPLPSPSAYLDDDFDSDAEESSDIAGDTPESPLSLPLGEIPTITVELRLGENQ